jgi:hypothetical protein
MEITTIRATAILIVVCVAASVRPSPAQCLGDFNGDGRVTVDELVTAVDNALNGCRLTAGPRFVDNGDGTVTDHQTGLMWEKKENRDGVQDLQNPHDTDNFYVWSTSPSVAMNGTVFTDFLSRLNACGSPNGGTVTGGFAGHCDWRLPTIAELAGIADLTRGNCSGGSGPCIDPIFGPTQADNYWSSTTDTSQTDGYAINNAWLLYFDGGSPCSGPKIGGSYVRAVRGGS